MMKRYWLLATGMMTTAMPLAAQTTPPAPPAPTIATAPAAPVDSARLGIATRIAGRLLPPGTYKAIMKAAMSQMTNGMLDKMLDMPMRSFASVGGLTPEQAAKLGPATMREIMAIVDPVFDQRMKLQMNAMAELMGNMMDEMEPDIRVGLSNALTTRFSLDQLTTLDQFFATPTGGAYAAQSMALYADPAVMKQMQGMMPRMMRELPGWMTKIDQATAGLPKPKKPGDLTPADRAKLRALMLADPAAKT